MPQSDVDLIRASYDSFARGDIPAVLANFADDVDWHTPDVLPHGKDVRGREAVATFFTDLAAQWSDFGLQIDDLVDAEGTVLSRGRATGTLNGSPTGYGFVHAFTIRDGKVARFDEYVAPPQGGFPQP